jgi:hypothetical protein
MSAVAIVTDAVTILTALNNTLALSAKLGALVTKMHNEGREFPTPEELAELQADDDAARALESAAIAQAKAEGR